MKKFFAILIMTLAFSFSLSAQEHTPRPTSTPRQPAHLVQLPATPPRPFRRSIPAAGCRFTSDQGRFSVLMPEIPKDKIETTPSAHGPYTTHLFIVKDTTSVYLIGWVDYDPSFNFNRQAELEANRDNFVKGVKAKLISSRPTVIDGYSALEFTAETAEQDFQVARLHGRAPALSDRHRLAEGHGRLGERQSIF